MTRKLVDEVLDEVVNPWRSDDLPDCVEEMDLRQVLELRGELDAERERLEELIEQVDDVVGSRDEEIEAELAALA